MKRAYADTAEGQIHYAFEGSGEPLILLHHAGFSSMEFKEMVPLLSPHFRVMAVDLPGHGSSDALQGDPAVVDYARAMLAFIDTLGIQRASFGGVHTGAEVSLKMAATYPERVSKVILYGTLFRDKKALDEVVPERFMRGYKIRPDGSHMVRIWDSERFMAEDATPELLHVKTVEHLRAHKGTGPAHLACYVNAVTTADDLIRAKCPILFVRGTKDPLYEDVARAHALVPHQKMVEVPDGNTLVALMRPREFANEIISFLRS